jgi:hypothetical protein
MEREMTHVDRSDTAAPPAATNDFYKTNGRRASTVMFTEGPSMTRQEFAEECDINSIMRRYEGHVSGGPGNLPPVAGTGMYIDFAEMPDNLMDYLQKIKDAENAFMTLPAVVRKEFENDALAFVDYASNPENLDQMREWGLAPPAKSPAMAPGSPAAVPGASPPSEAPEVAPASGTPQTAS